jgi:YVTN family beta-propeller protein
MDGDTRGITAPEHCASLASYRAAIVFVIVLCRCGPLVGQSVPQFVQSFPSGRRPIGIATTGIATPAQTIYSAIANSESNSVSIYSLRLSSPTSSLVTIKPSATILGIPAPFGIANCDSNDTPLFLVTSPSDNSVTFVNPDAGTIVRTVKVGQQPYSAACLQHTAWVSNYLDSSVSILDLNSFTVTRTISNVPGNRSLHGVMLVNGRLYIAGTDSNTVSILSSDGLDRIATIPVNGPTFLGYDGSIVVGIPSQNRFVRFGENSLTLDSTVSGIPTPQDWAGYVTTGPADSVAVITGNNVSFQGGIAGATGIALGVFYSGNALRPPIVSFRLVTPRCSPRAV